MNIVAQTPPPATGLGPDRIQAILLGHFIDVGYGRIEPPVLQEAATFLDLGGEDMRSRLYLTSDASGAELCLRPEYTIPACRLYLASPEAGRPAAYSYFGPVFRVRSARSGEFLQAGLESFGRTDIAAADAEILTLALEAATAAGAPPFRISMGDAGLTARFLDAIGLPALWQRRLRRGLERGQPLDAVLDGAPSGAPQRSGLVGALAGADGKDARALVEDLLSIAGIAAVGGRSVGEIAERFLHQVAQQASPGLGDERRAMLERFLGIRGDPDQASATLRTLARDARLDLAASLDLFDERLGFMAANGIDVARLAFSAGFARNLDYYTGFVFEARAVSETETGGASPAETVLIGGGRYDRLAEALGSTAAIPAVGASIWVERLAEYGAAA
ncbi:MAG TPA: ATP phosphoribosyltransferase regulatory subunit [Lichenihabitans sp.]|nr:ATP phosphoribosyltransferase regulatory subunit [Lichenihabitans sp.]